MPWSPLIPGGSALWAGVSASVESEWANADTSPPIVPWLLAYGVWRDGGVWDDTQFWQDGSTWAVVTTGVST